MRDELNDIPRGAAAVRAAGAARLSALAEPEPWDEDWKRCAFQPAELTAFRPYGDGVRAEALPGRSAPGTEADPSNPEPVASGTELAESPALRLVFERGRLATLELSEAARASGVRVEGLDVLDAAAAERLARFAVDSPDRADARAWAELSHGARILVPAGVGLEAPIVVEFLEGGEGAFAAPRLFLELGRNARAGLRARFRSAGAGSDADCAVAGGVVAELAEGSRLDGAILQSFSDGTPAYLRLDAALGANAVIVWREFHLGSSRVRARSSVRLEGEGARADLEGAWVLAEGQVADLGTVQRHLAPGTASDALYKGVVAPGGRSAFRGLIEVAKAASKTDAYLANRNLLLGPGARADSLPALAIGTNDVRCTHGSTTGRVDPAQVHYLETRGIPSAEARRLVADGFAGEIADRVPESMRDLVAAALAERMARAAAGGVHA